MRAIDVVLKLRPTNAANRLDGDVPVCLLNPRDLLRALEEKQAPLLICELGVPSLLGPGVFAAARSSDALLGLSTPSGEAGARIDPHVWFRQAIAAAEEAAFRLPTFLRGTVTIASSEGRAVDAGRERVFKYVDAGFTSVCVDISALDLSEGASAVAEVAEPVRERELCLEIVSGAESPEALEDQLLALSARGISPDVIHLSEQTLSDADRLVALAEAARPAVLSIQGAPASPVLAGAGLRVADASTPLAALLAGAAIDPFAAAESIDADRRLRLEALAWNEMMALLDQSGAEGTATPAIEFLAEHSGY